MGISSKRVLSHSNPRYCKHHQRETSDWRLTHHPNLFLDCHVLDTNNLLWPHNPRGRSEARSRKPQVQLAPHDDPHPRRSVIPVLHSLRSEPRHSQLAILLHGARDPCYGRRARNQVTLPPSGRAAPPRQAQRRGLCRIVCVLHPPQGRERHAARCGQALCVRALWPRHDKLGQVRYHQGLCHARCAV